MGYYRIINITNRLGKRDINKDRELSVEYNIGFTKRIHKIKSGDELIISSKSLPVSAHQLRLKGLVNVIEISENEFTKLQKPSAGKKVQEAKKKVEEPKKVEPTTTKSVDEDQETEEDSDDKKTKSDSSSSSKKSTSKSKTKKSSYSTVKSDSDD